MSRTDGPSDASLRSVERKSAVGGGGLDAIEDLVLAGTNALGKFGNRRRPAEFLRERPGGGADLQAHLLQPARNPYRPALVAKPALDLPDDGRCGIRRELDTSRRVVTVDCLDQADGRDLDEVVVRFAAVAEASGQMLHEWLVDADQLAADVAATRFVRGEHRQPEPGTLRG